MQVFLDLVGNYSELDYTGLNLPVNFAFCDYSTPHSRQFGSQLHYLGLELPKVSNKG